jgi:hypothetical protein
MKKFISVLVMLLLLIGTTCFAASSANGQTNSYNAARLVVQGPQNSKLSYSKMPAFTLTFRTKDNKMIEGYMFFVDGKTGKIIQSRYVCGGTNFVPPGERRNYIIVFYPRYSNQVAYWSIKKNYKAVGNRYFYELYTTKYSIGAVG